MIAVKPHFPSNKAAGKKAHDTCGMHQLITALHTCALLCGMPAAYLDSHSNECKHCQSTVLGLLLLLESEVTLGVAHGVKDTWQARQGCVGMRLSYRK